MVCIILSHITLIYIDNFNKINLFCNSKSLLTKLLYLLTAHKLSNKIKPKQLFINLINLNAYNRNKNGDDLDNQSYV